MKKNKQINNFAKNKKSLMDKVDSLGGVKYFSEPIKVTINPFHARLYDKFEPKEVSIIGVTTYNGHLGFNCIDAGNVGVCVADFYDGNQFKIIENAL